MTGDTFISGTFTDGLLEQKKRMWQARLVMYLSVILGKGVKIHFISSSDVVSASKSSTQIPKLATFWPPPSAGSLIWSSALLWQVSRPTTPYNL